MSGLFQVPFFEDEATASWLSRLARANGRHSPYVFCSDLGLSLIAIGRGDEHELFKLARIAGQSPAVLVSRALRAGENGSTYLALENFPGRMLRKSKPSFCLRCLEDDDRDTKRMPGTRRYQRVSWLFRDVETCGKHGCELVGLPLMRGYHGLDFCNLLSEVELVNREPEARQASPFELFICDRLSGRRCHGTMLDAFSAAACIDLALLLGVPASLGRDKSYRGLDRPSRRLAVSRGFAILEAGESGIANLLDTLAASRESRGDFGGVPFYGTLYDRLSKSHAGAEFDQIREIIRQHAKAAIPMPTGTRLFGRAAKTPWITVTEVARQSGLAPSVIRKLLREDGSLPRKGHLVHKDVAATLAQALNGSLTHDQAAALIEVPRGVFPRFVQAGLITACPATAAEGYTTEGVKTRYPGEDIRKLHRLLLEKSDSPRREGMVSAREASRQSKIPLTTIARLLLQGNLTASRVENAESLFERIHVVPDELLRAVNQAPGLSSRSAAARIGVSKIALIRLRDKLVIPARRVTSPRQEAYVFSEDDLRAFEDQYISLGRLSGQLGVHRNKICQRMRELGISSAFANHEVGCHLIRRHDAKRLSALIQAELRHEKRKPEVELS